MVFFSPPNPLKKKDKEKRNKGVVYQPSGEAVSFFEPTHPSRPSKDPKKQKRRLKTQASSSPPPSSKRVTTSHKRQQPIQPVKADELVDIIYIHEKILKQFEEEESELETYRSQLQNVLWISEHSPVLIERFNAKQQVDKLREKIFSIENGIEIGFYLCKSQKIINEYLKTLSDPIHVDFMGTHTQANKRKRRLINEYLDIAREYIPVEDVILAVNIAKEKKREQSGGFKCTACSNRDQYEIKDDMAICVKCGASQRALSSNISYKDTKRVNLSTRYTYDRRTHFRDCINNFQAKQNTTIHQKVYDDLNHEIDKHRLDRSKLTKDHIYIFLKETGHSNHYDDITLIYCRITGAKPPDISHLESDLMRMFDTIVPIYNQVKPLFSESRKNFLNSQYILYQFLRQLKYPCSREDFSILKSRDKLLEHDEIYQEICKRVEWTFLPTV